MRKFCSVVIIAFLLFCAVSPAAFGVACYAAPPSSSNSGLTVININSFQQISGLPYNICVKFSKDLTKSLFITAAVENASFKMAKNVQTIKCAVRNLIMVKSKNFFIGSQSGFHYFIGGLLNQCFQIREIFVLSAMLMFIIILRKKSGNYIAFINNNIKKTRCLI